MNKPTEVYVKFIGDIAKFFANFKGQWSETDLSQGNKVDLLCQLYKVRSEIDDFISLEKKLLDFGDTKEIRGESAKAKLTIRTMTEIPVGPIAERLAFEDFKRVVKVVKSKLGAFLTKPEIKGLEEVTTETRAISFDSL